MSDELWNQIAQAAAKIRGVTILAPAEAAVIIDEVARNFVRDRSKALWWTALTVPWLSVNYDSKSGGRRELESALEGLESAFMIVSDERSDPMGVVSGRPNALVDLLFELRWFEMIMVSPDLSRAVFDTHHNSLIIAEAPHT